MTPINGIVIGPENGKLYIGMYNRQYVFDHFFLKDDLLTNFLECKVPIGILIDYIEEKPELLTDRISNSSNQMPHKTLDHYDLIQNLRYSFKDPTELYTHKYYLYRNNLHKCT